MESPHIPQSETLLIREASIGSRAAFDELAQECNARIYRVSLRILKNCADAEDNVQNTLCKAFTKMSQFKGQSRFSTWLIRIATNEALMTIRKRRARRDFAHSSTAEKPDCQEKVVEITDRKANPEREYLVKELAEKALRELPSALKDAFVLQQLEGWTNRELAARQNISTQTMKSRMFRARTILARRLPFVISARKEASVRQIQGAA
jgi:RNA polymerase sigma-70 factor (ECF subfamily)